MSKHTPAPWILAETKHKDIISSWNVVAGDHCIIVFPYKRIYSDDGSRSGLVICEEKMANAQLIAAAPDLLEACKRIVGSLGVMIPDADNDPDIIFARAAIAKAEGKA